MGRSVGDAAAQAVARSKKKEVVDRTPEQIIRDIRNNLDAKLAVTPLDVRFLLERYNEARAALQASAPRVDEQPVLDFTTGETISRAEFHVQVPKHVGDTVRIISEVGPVNGVGDVKEANAQKSQ